MPDLNILQVDLFLPVSRIQIVLLGGNRNEEINPEIKNTQMGYQDQVSWISRSSIRDIKIKVSGISRSSIRDIDKIKYPG